MSLKSWAATNENQIEEWLNNREYTKLLNEYYKTSGQSITRLAVSFQCSRRALNRYLSGQRQVPFSIIKIMLNTLGINTAINDTNIDDNSYMVWRGEPDTLFNLMFAYRILHMKWNKFEAACNLNIPIEKISDYECGLRKMPVSDIKKILEVYGLKIEELFPELVSYDGRRTFLPLRPVSEFSIDGTKYDILYDEKPLYMSPQKEELLIWPSFPIMRYNCDGTPLLNYMPNELTIDEYINTSDLIFLKKDYETYFEYDFSGKKLPPSYRHLLEKSKKSYSVKIHTKVISDIIFTDDYNVILQVGSKNNTFDLHDYVFSDSIWYSMLQDITYFWQGKLKYIGHQIFQNLSIVWPDGQYVRIIELYLDKYPNQHLTNKTGIGGNEFYDNWTDYEI